MYKNQLQELAQRSCFNLPSYSCIREGPDHAPRFKAAVNFNGEVFECPHFCSTLRQAEHSAAEVALNSLSNRGPSHSLAARILDETGVYKNLLQEISQRVGAALPVYTTVRSGLGHLPVFTCTVELAGITFAGEPAKNKKQAEKNAAMAAWASLKHLAQLSTSSSSETVNNDEQEQVTIARTLLNYRLKEKIAMANSSTAPSPFPEKFLVTKPRPSTVQPPPITSSKILPLIRPKSAPRPRSVSDTISDSSPQVWSLQSESTGLRTQKFPAVDAIPYVPIQHFRAPYHRVAPPVTIRNAIPVFSAPPIPAPAKQPHFIGPPLHVHVAPPVRVRQAVPAFAAPSVRMEQSPASAVPSPPQPPLLAKPLAQVDESSSKTFVQVEEGSSKVAVTVDMVGSKIASQVENAGSEINIDLQQQSVVAAKSGKTGIEIGKDLQESVAVEGIEKLKI
ncbi:hypothetical protein Syun_016875 [Stephania yunnanensis]|uniref:DRBM domain-containing protein n=1 Tax=Stephania yunnanensis TaxID=152371 RepID=A0AAP0P2J4_9MAGN